MPLTNDHLERELYRRIGDLYSMALEDVPNWEEYSDIEKECIELLNGNGEFEKLSTDPNFVKQKELFYGNLHWVNQYKDDMERQSVFARDAADLVNVNPFEVSLVDWFMVNFFAQNHAVGRDRDQYTKFAATIANVACSARLTEASNREPDITISEKPDIADLLNLCLEANPEVNRLLLLDRMGGIVHEIKDNIVKNEIPISIAQHFVVNDEYFRNIVRSEALDFNIHEKYGLYGLKLALRYPQNIGVQDRMYACLTAINSIGSLSNRRDIDLSPDSLSIAQKVDIYQFARQLLNENEDRLKKSKNDYDRLISRLHSVPAAVQRMAHMKSLPQHSGYAASCAH
jgi:hypothetical protein